MSIVKRVLISTLAGAAFCFVGCSSQNIIGTADSEQNNSKSARLIFIDDPVIDSLSFPLTPQEWEVIPVDIVELIDNRN